MGRITINETCIQCGSCLGLGMEYLAERNDGSVYVKEGYDIVNSKETQELIDVCPVGAISYIDETRDPHDELLIIIEKLEKVEMLQELAERDNKFSAKDYYISYGYPSGEHNYKYNSDSAATRAGLEEFDRVMYSQINGILTNVLSQFLAQKCQPYVTLSAEEGSVYAKKEQEIRDLLQIGERLCKQMGRQLPSWFTDINISHNHDIYWTDRDRAEIISDYVNTIRKKFDSNEYYRLSSYDSYIDTSDMEEYKGHGLFGDRYDTKYCYYNVVYV